MRNDGVKCFLLGAIAALLMVLVVQGMRNDSEAKAAGGGPAAANGIVGVIGGNNNDNLYMLDTNNQVICVYEYSSGKFRLMAARNYQYDTKVKSEIYSRSGLDWKDVRKALQEERR